MTRRLLLLTVFPAIAACGGASAVLQEAGQALEDADRARAAKRYPAAVKHIERALALVERLPNEAPRSPDARALAAGTLTIAGLKIGDVRTTLLIRAKVRAAASRDPGACALLLAERAGGERDRTRARRAVVDRLSQGPPEGRRLAGLAARWIERTDARAQALGKVSAAHARHREPKRALALAEEALAAARAVDNVLRKPAVLGAAVKTFLATGHADRALAVARTIPQGDPKTAALTTIAMALGKAGRGEEATVVLTEALDASETIERPAHRALRLAGLAEIYARGDAAGGARKLLTRATKLAGQLAIRDQEAALAAIVAVWALMRDAANGAKAARLIPSEPERGEALRLLALSGGSPALLSDAIATLKSTDALSAALAGQASGLQSAGRGDMALETASRIPSPLVKAQTLITLARQGRTEALVEAADEASRAVFQDRDRAATLTRLAVTLLTLGRGEEAKAALRDAYSEAGSRPDRLLAIARAARDESQPKVAHGALRQASTAALKTKDAAARATQLLEATLQLVALTDGPDVTRGIAGALAAISHVELEGVQARLLTLLTKLLKPAGRAASPHLDGVFTAIMALGDKNRRSANLHRLAAAYAALGRFDGARRAADAIGTPLEVDAALVEVAEEAAGTGRFALAVATAEGCSSALHRATALAGVAYRWNKAGRPSDRALSAALTRVVTR